MASFAASKNHNKETYEITIISNRSITFFWITI